MDAALFQQLNQIYAALRGRARRLTQVLVQSGLETKWGWYSDHSVLIEGEYQTEEFPIPVVEVPGLCEVGFHLDGCWLEFQLPREAALVFDWAQLPEDAEVYGVENYLEDFYHTGMDKSGIPRRVAQSREQTVGIALAFPPVADDAALLAAVEKCRRWKEL